VVSIDRTIGMAFCDIILGMGYIGPKFRLVSTERRPFLKVLRKSVEPIYQNRLHTHFTDHSIIHCDRVAELAEKLLIPLKNDIRLNDDESTVLYASCYLHDIGMQNEKAGEGGRLATKLKANGREWADIHHLERLDIIRRHHHEISADMVLESVGSGHPAIGHNLKEQDHPDEIAAICEAHCVDTRSQRYDELTRGGERSTMRLRLLSAILRLADVLDEAHHRALVEQRRTLDLDLESRMHWWRHYFTREVEVEPKKNRITIWFSFPTGKRDEYARIVPTLQMPWIEQEFARHRAVLAENGLSWHLGWQINDGPFATLEQMPPEVESFMVQELARRNHLASQQSRADILKHFSASRLHLMRQVRELNANIKAVDSTEYLNQTLRLARDLWSLGSRLTARHYLRSGLFFATTNGRSVPSALHIEAAIALARMQADDHEARDSVLTLAHIKQVADGLEDNVPVKMIYYRLFASLTLSAGYFEQGSAAVQEAIRLLAPGSEREQIGAELVEATVLEGQWSPPSPASKGGE
jgi:hypothetical protein